MRLMLLKLKLLTILMIGKNSMMELQTPKMVTPHPLVMVHHQDPIAQLSHSTPKMVVSASSMIKPRLKMLVVLKVVQNATLEDQLMT
jgi:hypothetical protein